MSESTGRPRPICIIGVMRNLGSPIETLVMLDPFMLIKKKDATVRTCEVLIDPFANGNCPESELRYIREELGTGKH